MSEEQKIKNLKRKNIIMISIIVIIPIVFFSLVITSNSWFDKEELEQGNGENENGPEEINEEDISLGPDVWHPLFDRPILLIILGVGIIGGLMMIYMFFQVNKQAKIISIYRKSKTQKNRDKLKEEMEKGTLTPFGIILITARKLDSELREEFVSTWSKADACIYKPFEMDDLLESIATVGATIETS